MDLTSLIIQLLAGVAGRNAVGKSIPIADLGALGNSIAGAIGGAGGGQLLLLLIPALASAASSGSLDIGALIGQVVGGGAGGAILTVVAGLLKNMMSGQRA